MKNKQIDYRTKSFFSLKNETVIVTGVSGQLGSEIVRALILNDARVVAIDSNLETLDEQPHSNNLINFECDISNRKALADVYTSIIEKGYIPSSIICNAGVSVFEEYLERTESSIDFVMDVNLKGTIFCIQEFLKSRKKVGGAGSIVNIASHYGIVSPDPRIYTDCERKNSEIYGATKAGIIQMTKYYAVHAADLNVRTNCISPGGIRNPDNPQGADFQANYSFRCPMGRMAETHEIIGAILFLLSPAASYINGINIIIDGGTTAW